MLSKIGSKFLHASSSSPISRKHMKLPSCIWLLILLPDLAMQKCDLASSSQLLSFSESFWFPAEIFWFFFFFNKFPNGRKLKGKERKSKHGVGVIFNMKCSRPNVLIHTAINMESLLSEWMYFSHTTVMKTRIWLYSFKYCSYKLFWVLRCDTTNFCWCALASLHLKIQELMMELND